MSDPPPPPPQLSPDGKFWWDGHVWQPYPSPSSSAAVHTTPIRLLSCTPKWHGGEFWFGDATVDDVADLFLRFFLAQGFRLQSGRASDGSYRKGNWWANDNYRVKIGPEAKSVRATVTADGTRRTGMVPLRNDLPIFRDDPAQQGPAETPGPEQHSHPGYRRRRFGSHGAPKAITVLPLTNDLLVFLSDPSNLPQASAVPGAAGTAGGLFGAAHPSPRSAGSSTASVFGIVIAVALAFGVWIYFSGTNSSGSSSGGNWYLHWRCADSQCAADMGGMIGVRDITFSSRDDCTAVQATWADQGTMQRWDGAAGDWCSQNPDGKETSPPPST